MTFRSQILSFSTTASQNFTACFAACVMLTSPAQSLSLKARSTSNGVPICARTSDPSIVLHARIFLLSEDTRSAEFVRNDLLSRAEAGVGQLQNETVAAQARETLASLSDALGQFDMRALPLLDLTESDDGSATLEWRLPGRRLAFTLEPDRKDSGWHLVFSRSSGGSLAFGPSLLTTDLPKILAWAFDRFPA
jgi:hypothetical protein